MKKQFKVGEKARIISETCLYFKRGTIVEIRMFTKDKLYICSHGWSTFYVAPEQLAPLYTALDYILESLDEIEQKKSESEGQLIESMVKNDKK